MANMKPYSDINGETVELVGLHGMKNAEFAARFPGVKGRRHDSFTMQVGSPKGVNDVYDREAHKWIRTYLPVTRVIEFKSNPSRHECDARCMFANGKIMRCECSCGGKNHGKGAFICTAEAA
jgi:hypothetical protein